MKKHRISLWARKFFEKENTNENMKLCRNIQECLRNSDIVVSGIPFSKDGIIINSPYSDEK